jgi:hypothetical protein
VKCFFINVCWSWHLFCFMYINALLNWEELTANFLSNFVLKRRVSWCWTCVTNKQAWKGKVYNMVTMNILYHEAILLEHSEDFLSFWHSYDNTSSHIFRSVIKIFSVSHQKSIKWMWRLLQF